jgi:hypothetical protein
VRRTLVFDRIAALHLLQWRILLWHIWSSIQEIDAARLRAALSCCIIGTLRDLLVAQRCRSEGIGMNAGTGDHPDSQWVG